MLSQGDTMTMDEELYATENAPSKDWFLQFLVNMVNKRDIELEITLTVGGLLVSGTMIGARKFFDDLGEYFASSYGSNESSSDILNTFQEIGKQCSCIAPSEKTETPSYIHLKNAIFFNNPGASLSEKSPRPLWRARISEVQGFSPGK